jgi:hypothetical protein
MSGEDPQIIELDPDQAPRVTAIILLICGLLGAGFLLVNVVFTGDDPYYDQQAWEEGNEPVNQRFDIMPNLVRGRQPADADSEEDDEAQALAKLKKKPGAKSATAPVRSPYQLQPATAPSGTRIPTR